MTRLHDIALRSIACFLPGALFFAVGCSAPEEKAAQDTTGGVGGQTATATPTAATANTTAVSSSAGGGVGATTMAAVATTGTPTTTAGPVTTMGPVGTTGTTTVGASTVGASTTGGNMACGTTEEDLFSFFLISYEAVQRESGSPDGFGGDLGGISGADGICQRVAEVSSPCQVNKTWRAFLSTSTEDAIDRIGSGPWYDRLGRLLANTTADLTTDSMEDVRGLGAADLAIIDDLPNEYGVPNHNPSGNMEVDNHQTLTGTAKNGRLYTQDPDAATGGPSTSGFPTGGGFPLGTGCTGSDGVWSVEAATCWDWTSSEPKGCPRVGHSWPRMLSGINWLDVWNEGGCAPGVVLDEEGGGGPDGSPTVGSAGGYGGWYCFAVMPDQ